MRAKQCPFRSGRNSSASASPPPPIPSSRYEPPAPIHKVRVEPPPPEPRHESSSSPRRHSAPRHKPAPSPTRRGRMPIRFRGCRRRRVHVGRVPVSRNDRTSTTPPVPIHAPTARVRVRESSSPTVRIRHDVHRHALHLPTRTVSLEDCTCRDDTHPDAAGRNPAAACCPGAGWIAGCGPNRGLNAGFVFGCVGTFGFVDAIYCGSVRLRHELNSTVDPRYVAHLNHGQHESQQNSEDHDIPIAQCRPRHERHVPHHVHRLRVQPNHHALHAQRHAARVAHHRHPIAERKMLVLQPVDSMRGLDNGLPRDALHDRLLDRTRRPALLERVLQRLNLRD